MYQTTWRYSLHLWWISFVVSILDLGTDIYISLSKQVPGQHLRLDHFLFFTRSLQLIVC
jgi:hypothetical protein